MTYKTHVTTGLLFSTIYFMEIKNISPELLTIIFLILSTVIGSSAPDLDTPSGGIWKNIPAGSVISRIVKPIFIGGHRHISHSFIGLFLLSSIYFLLLKILFNKIGYDLIILSELAFIIGYCSHLLADMFTESGVPILFPLDYHFGIPPIKKVRIKTGKWFENLVIYPILNFILVWLIVKEFFSIFLPKN